MIYNIPALSVLLPTSVIIAYCPPAYSPVSNASLISFIHQFNNGKELIVMANFNLLLA